jgi:predicted Zn-dependent protease
MKSLLAIFIFTLVGCVTTPETGRQAFIITSESEEAALGVQAYHEILSKEKIANNPQWNAILQRVGSRIAKAANRPNYQWEFKLIESTQKNAFCLPGGKVAVYTGILPLMKNEAGMAVVLGHEVAHATARHGGQRISSAMGTQLGLAALGELIGGDDKSTQKQLLMAALGVGANIGVALPFSRANESEADEIGLIYMARAGYDPNEAPRFWDRFASESGSPPEFLSTHPNSANRRDALTSQIPKVMPIYERSPKTGLGESF